MIANVPIHFALDQKIQRVNDSWTLIGIEIFVRQSDFPGLALFSRTSNTSFLGFDIRLSWAIRFVTVVGDRLPITTCIKSFIIKTIRIRIYLFVLFFCFLFWVENLPLFIYSFIYLMSSQSPSSTSYGLRGPPCANCIRYFTILWLRPPRH